VPKDRIVHFTLGLLKLYIWLVILVKSDFESNNIGLDNESGFRMTSQHKNVKQCQVLKKQSCPKSALKFKYNILLK